jgi:hypothetical protein
MGTSQCFARNGGLLCPVGSADRGAWRTSGCAKDIFNGQHIPDIQIIRASLFSLPGGRENERIFQASVCA